MNTITKLARKIGLRKLKYYTIHIKPDDYISFKVLAVHTKKNYIDLFHDLLDIYIQCKRTNMKLSLAIY